MVEQTIINYMVNQGPFALLFVWLLFYVMKNNKERESRLHDLLDKFSEKYDVIIEKLDDLKERVHKGE